MKTIRCNFVDLWENPLEIGWIAPLLSEYDLVIDEKNPDYLFYSCFGNKHLQYNNCIKIFLCGENILPDFNLCDYALSLSTIDYADRTFRIRIPNFYEYEQLKRHLDADTLLNRRFCNFVYRNSNADPIRVRFFQELSKYKKVDSASSLMNNMEGPVSLPTNDDLMDFQRQYKFTIAMENSSFPGYITEKILHPFLAMSLPIYWGAPNISSDYNPNSFVNIMDYSSVEEAIEEVIRLDNDDAAYLEKMNTPFWNGDSFESFQQSETERLLAFYRHIFEQPKENAFRRTSDGWMGVYTRDMQEKNIEPTCARLIKKNYKSCVRMVCKKVILFRLKIKK